MNFFIQLPRYVYLIFVFVFILVLWRVANIDLYNSNKGRDSIHGDGYTDKFTYSAAQFFHDYGFKKTFALPVLDYKGDFDTKGTGVYTHYPAYPDIINGITAKILNTKSDKLLRITPVLFSVILFFLLFKTLITMLPDKKWALIAGSIIVLSNYFIAWADNLHKHLYEEFYKWLYVFLLYLYYEAKAPGKIRLAILALVFFIIANVSFDGILYAAVVTVGFSIIYNKSILTKEVFVLGLAATLGFGFHLLQNIFYFGSIQSAIADLKNAFFQRTAGETQAGYINELGRPVYWYDRIALIGLYWPNRIERFFLVPGWAMIIIGAMCFRTVKKNNPKLFKILLCLCVATFSWSLLMVQHTLVHIFNTRHIGLFYALMLGCCLPIYFNKLKQAFSPGAPVYLKIFHGGLLIYIFAMVLSQQVFDLYIRYGFAYPYFGK